MTIECSQSVHSIVVYSLLLKVCHTGLEDLQILFAVDILCNASVAALGVRHLAQDTSIPER